ncbi:MAG: T9SS type A sorting domain-containing protein [Bacteroidales bacterium]|nr:T9SS type A sorting domain-containing protein [Bacteroidales bacterium]
MAVYFHSTYRQLAIAFTLFNASKLPSGIYFLHLQTGNEVKTRKMIKVK